MAAEFSVCERTAAKWTRRYRQQHDRRFIRPFLSSGCGPHAARRRRSGAASRTASSPALHRPAHRSGHRPESRHRQPHPSPPGLKSPARILNSAVPVIRYEHPTLRDLLHLDIKHLGRPTEIAVRADVGDAAGNIIEAGNTLAVSSPSTITPASLSPRSCLTLPALRAVAFLHAAVAYYATLGIRIRRLLTDNGHCYRSGAFREALPAARPAPSLHSALTRPALTEKPNVSHPNRPPRMDLRLCVSRLRATERADVCLATSLQLASPPW